MLFALLLLLLLRLDYHCSYWRFRKTLCASRHHRCPERRTPSRRRSVVDRRSGLGLLQPLKISRYCTTCTFPVVVVVAVDDHSNTRELTRTIASCVANLDDLPTFRVTQCVFLFTVDVTSSIRFPIRSKKMGEFYARSFFLPEARTHERTNRREHSRWRSSNDRSKHALATPPTTIDHQKNARPERSFFVTHPLTHTVEEKL